MSTLEFYQKNKDCSWTLPDVPSNLTTNIEIASWLLNQTDFGWLELDINIDIGGWQLESLMSAPWLVPHREDENTGWNSACLHGIDIASTGAWTNYGYTEEKTVPYHWTSLSYRAPTIRRFWETQFPTDKYRRIRFMELEPDCAINPHSDMPGRLPGEENFDALAFGIPINIAVIQPDNCYMVLEGKGVVPFKEGKAFIVNIRHTHAVINQSDEPRMHVIGHSYGYGERLEEFAELVVRSYNLAKIAQ